jgi:L-ascorbate metabolism protein UlaG (beta-lactamase superfamily)
MSSQQRHVHSDLPFYDSCSRHRECLSISSLKGIGQRRRDTSQASTDNMATTKPSLAVDMSKKQPAIRSERRTGQPSKEELPIPRSSQTHPGKTSNGPDETNASLFFIGTATTILEWNGLRLMTDPNFLHAGDHVHLGPGVTGTRKTNPAVDLEDLPPIDVVLLSHYHADHFDQKVEAELRRDLPIITTPHAQKHLGNKQNGESFSSVHALDAWEDMYVDLNSSSSSGSSPPHQPRLHVTGMPGKHVGDGLLSQANDILGAVPPTNGWMLELGYGSGNAEFSCGYRIYISGDTLFVNELEKIPELYTHAGKPIDLMLVHLGGTTIPGPSMPLLMVTMDAEQGLKLVQLVQPHVTIPIHYE